MTTVTKHPRQEDAVIMMSSYEAPWHLKLLKICLFIPQFVKANKKENTKSPHYIMVAGNTNQHTFLWYIR